ncbi:MAG: circularly permuted type 2 ATP-grasp protein [Rubrobacteraceae bacterium]|nr:circularly permuted type 2 ATP-grasp protein [Rubrobacteraceae bacterium]
MVSSRRGREAIRHGSLRRARHKEPQRLGGKDVLIAPEESDEAIEEFRKQVEQNPVEYVAQRPLDFSTHVLCEIEDDEFVLRDAHADYRVHALAPDAQTVEVVPGAMTRVAAPGSKLVNISSGGKMKDTWVLK